ncbi:hypothetical protein [Planctomycetes bacterium TBK1r]|uniref:Uncharacterized protein n=1 Tax=Stieleria magnilauensis TaxID=2527963 RepID=A0ABX5XVM8_9BACT|nr:hypothetical protein TBK1r_50800 [Planctomycetes bacterium TBK1r]
MKTATIPNDAPIGPDCHANAQSVRVPFVLIDDIAGPLWYPRPMSSDDAARMAETINASGGNARVVDVEIILPPAADVASFDNVTPEPLRVTLCGEPQPDEP